MSYRLADPPKTLGLSFRCAQNFLLSFEIILLLLLLVIVGVNFFNGLTWLPIMVNSCFAILSAVSVVMMFIGRRKLSALHFLPVLCFETTSIFWVLVWMYACMTSVITGYLWSVEWLGGPQSSREVFSKDIQDRNYFDPSQTNPETQKSITYSGGIMGFLMLLFCVKLVLWQISKNSFVYYQQLAVFRAEKIQEYGPSDLDVTPGVHFRKNSKLVKPEIVIEEYQETPRKLTHQKLRSRESELFEQYEYPKEARRRSDIYESII